MITTEDGEEVSAAEFAAGMVEGTAKTEYVGGTKVVSARLPVHLAVYLQAMAQKMGKTRAACMEMLLEVGLEEVRKHLSEETCKELSAIEQELFRDEYGQEVV